MSTPEESVLIAEQEIEEEVLAEATDALGIRQRLKAKSKTFIHHCHVFLSPLTDGNFAAAVRTVEGLGGGVIHRIIPAETSSEGPAYDQHSLGQKRKEINGSEKYVLINTYSSVQAAVEYLKKWKNSGLRPDYAKWYGEGGSKERKSVPFIAATHIPRTGEVAEQGVAEDEVGRANTLVSASRSHSHICQPHPTAHFSSPEAVLEDSRKRRGNSSNVDGADEKEEEEDIVFLFGSEITPIPSQLLALASATFSIPLLGVVESYNLSFCIGLTYYCIRKAFPEGDGRASSISTRATASEGQDTKENESAQSEDDLIFALFLRRRADRRFVKMTRQAQAGSKSTTGLLTSEDAKVAKARRREEWLKKNQHQDNDKEKLKNRYNEKLLVRIAELESEVDGLKRRTQQEQ